MYNILDSFLGKKSDFKKDGHMLPSGEATSLPFGTNCLLKSIPVVPGEHYKVDVSGYVQTNPMREDNFASLNTTLKAVFVPVSSIYRDYMSQTTSARETRKDSLYPEEDVPFINLRHIAAFYWYGYLLQRLWQNVLSWCGDSYSESTLIVEKDDNNSFNIVKLSKNTLDGTSSQYSPGSNVYIDAFLCLFKYWPVGSTGRNVTYTIPFLYEKFRSQFVNSRSLHLFVNDFLRICDHIGYGNFTPIFEDFVTYWSKLASAAFVNDYDPRGSSGGNYNGLFGLYFNTTSGTGSSEFCMSCADYFGMVDQKRPFHNISSAVNALPLFCLQYYFALCERSNFRKADTKVLTLDYLMSMGVDDQYTEAFINLALSPSDTAENYGISVLCGHDFNKVVDYDVSICVQEFYNIATTGFVSFSAILNYLFSLCNPLLEPDVFTTSQTSKVYGSIPAFSNFADFNQNPIQRMADTSALYKLQQDLLRAGVSRAQQMRTMFGTGSADVHILEDVFVLGRSTSPIKIQGLINMAETEVAPLGERGSRGNGASGLKFEFNSQGFGFIFILACVTTPVFYENFMLHRSLKLDPKSWFNARNNHLGLDVVRRGQLCFMPSDSSNARSLALDVLNDPDDVTAGRFSTVNENASVGFSARNWHLISSVNLLHGLFTQYAFDNLDPTDTSTVQSGSRNRYVSASLARGNALFGGFLPSVISQQVSAFSKESDMYYSPFMVNNLFVNMVDGAAYDGIQFDQFPGVFHFNVRKVSPMPKLGLIKLD